MNALTKVITNSKVKEVFFETFNELNSLSYESCTKSNNVFRLGIDKNHKRYTKEEAEEVRTKAERKAFEQKILGLIAEKQEDSLKGKSIEELIAMLNA